MNEGDVLGNRYDHVTQIAEPVIEESSAYSYTNRGSRRVFISYMSRAAIILGNLVFLPFVGHWQWTESPLMICKVTSMISLSIFVDFLIISLGCSPRRWSIRVMILVDGFLEMLEV